MKNVYYVGSGELTFELIERIINENLKLELAPEAKERIQKCRDYLDKKTVESAEPLYGITTGFGLEVKPDTAAVFNIIGTLD